MALNLIMMGPPGAGKGTQAEQFARKRGIPKISTGDILREAVQHGTEIGRQANATMARGELVSDDVMIGIVRERLDQGDARNGFVLDGFPRTVAQARALDEIVKERDPLIVVDIVVPEGELVRRLSTRMVCEVCSHTAGAFDPGVQAAEGGKAAECQRCGGRLVQRNDDDNAVVRERLKVYQRQTQPLVEYYSERPTFRSVNGSQAPDRVASDLTAAIDSAWSGVAVKGARS
jgi:adenylate kinase